MELISKNIKYLRGTRGWTQEQLASKLDIKRSLVGAYEESRADPRLTTLLKLASLFHTTVDVLISKDVEDSFNGENLEISKAGNQVLAITIDEEGRENIEIVPQKAAAGYKNGYSDPEYIKELPRFKLPILPENRTYRAFEIVGDSMLPIQPGSIVVGEYVEDIMDIKNGKTYILVTRDDGIVYKRVFNYINDSGNLFLVSDNRQYSPYQIKADEVIEAWSAKAFISVDFPEDTNSSDVNVDQLATMVLDLKKEINSLKNNKN